MLPTACPKQEPRKRTKARARRVESLQAQKVRAQVFERDGDCRLNVPSLVDLFGACSGESEWAHLGDMRRFKTRGKAPAERHTTAGSLRLCSGHHAQYDGRARPRIGIQPASSDGADGRLGFFKGAAIYVEPGSALRAIDRGEQGR